MDLWQIRYFLVVAEEKSISSAANRLHMSQPPLSRHIKALEEEVGVPLFVRKTYGLVLTEAGKLLQKRGKELIDLYEKDMDELKDISAKKKNKIIFGANDGGRDLVVPLYAKMFRKRFCNAEVVSHYISTAEIKNRILKGDIDIGFIRLPFFNMEQFDIVELNNENWIVLMAQDFPVPHDWNDDVTLEQLSSQPLIMPSRQALYLPLVEALTVNMTPPNVICYYFELEKAVTLAKHGLGIAIVPSSIEYIIQNHGCIVKNIQELEMTTCYAAIKRKGDCSSETLRIFWDVIQRKESKVIDKQ